MRILISMVVLVMVSTVVFTQKTPKQPTIENTLEQYFTEPAKQTETKKLLREMDRAEIGSELVDYLDNEDTIESAIDLARDLNVQLDFAKRLDKDEPIRAKMVDLILATQDEKAIDDLYTRAKKDDSIRPLVWAGFMTYGINVKLLKKIKTDAFKEKDVELKSSMLNIIKFQLNRDMDDGELKRDWNKLIKDFELKATQSEVNGWDLIRCGDTTLKQTKPVGFNTLVQKGGEIKVNLRGERWQKKSLTIRAWIFLTEKSDVVMGIRCKIGVWSVNTTQDKWDVDVTGNQIKRLNNEWVEVVMKITDRSDQTQSLQTMTMTIGGNELFPQEGISSGLEEIWIGCTEDEMVVSSISAE